MAAKKDTPLLRFIFLIRVHNRAHIDSGGQFINMLKYQKRMTINILRTPTKE
jgi:hypothetical protein